MKNHLNFEIRRKLFHLSSLLIPSLAYLLPFKITFLLLSLGTFIVLLIDIGRFIPGKFSKLSFSILNFFNFNALYRKEEEKRLSGASYIMISSVICLQLLPVNIFIISFVILAISDSLSAIIGIKFGKHKLLNKSWEGTLTFFISSLMIALPLAMHFKYLLFNAFIASLFTTILELSSKKLKLDDNLLIPITFGFVLYVLETNF